MQGLFPRHPSKIYPVVLDSLLFFTDTPGIWNISCHISEPRMSQSLAIAATTDGELVSPEGTQEGREYLPSSRHQAVATPHNEPGGNSGCENTGPRKLRCMSKV